MFGKTNVMVSCGIIKDALSKSKVDKCRVFTLRVMATSVLYVQCCKSIHCSCARVKKVTAKFS